MRMARGIKWLVPMGVMLMALPLMSQDAEETAEMRQRREVLQKKIDVFPVMMVNTHYDQVAFTNLDVSATATPIGEKTYYAFRFHTPPQQGYLHWAFKVPEYASQWYILKATGTMEGFTGYSTRKLPQDEPTLGKAGDKIIYQQLERPLDANSDYIMWFLLADKEELKINVSLNVFPTEAVYPYHVYPKRLIE